MLTCMWTSLSLLLACRQKNFNYRTNKSFTLQNETVFKNCDVPFAQLLCLPVPSSQRVWLKASHGINSIRSAPLSKIISLSKQDGATAWDLLAETASWRVITFIRAFTSETSNFIDSITNRLMKHTLPDCALLGDYQPPLRLQQTNLKTYDMKIRIVAP